LRKDLFSADVVINQWLIHEYVVMYLANQRVAIAHTKTRWEVQRSWKKLFRQKWSWRARVWDAWSPIRRKWGVAFGPRNTVNFSKDMPKKMKRKALLHSLLSKIVDNKVVCVQWVKLELPKTSAVIPFVEAVTPLQKSLLVVLPSSDPSLLRSLRNIPYVTCQTAAQLNAYDVMSHQTIAFVNESLDALESLLLS
jgi:large subunit ribosomal protein L4